jgi:hypothetical protein
MIVSLTYNTVRLFLSALFSGANSSLDLLLGQTAEEMQTYAKENAPWTDRTGKARGTLTGISGANGDIKYCAICGQMPYSPSLELLHEQRFAILYPTVLSYVDVVLERTRAAIGGLGGVSVE